MRVVFMGTPAFAVASLDALVQAGHEVAAVYCQPDKPVGRGMKLAYPPVKEYALLHGLPVYQPVKLRDGVVAEQLKTIAPQSICVVAYGRILPPDILTIPPLGCINVHGSLLPKFRGAAPIQWAVLNGEVESGVTTMYMAEGLDTGDMILKRSVAVAPDMTAGQLHDALMGVGGALLVETLALLEQGTAPREVQDEQQATYAPMLDKSLCAIDWQWTAEQVVNRVRGLDPWPLATMVLKDTVLKVTGARVGGNSSGTPGSVHFEGSTLQVVAGDGRCVVIERVQAPGGRMMAAADYFRGAGRGLLS